MSEMNKASAIYYQNKSREAFILLQKAFTRKDIGPETLIHLQFNVTMFSKHARMMTE